jgi:hypothetical protein
MVGDGVAAALSGRDRPAPPAAAPAVEPAPVAAVGLQT